MKKSTFYLLFWSIALAACVSLGAEHDIQPNSNINDLVPYTSQSLGIQSVVPSDWSAFHPDGVFVRTMPQIDPTFLMFGLIPGLTQDQVLSIIMDQTGIQEMPASRGNRESGDFNWMLFSLEIQQGFLLDLNPDYGILIMDVALATNNGDVIAIATGTPVEERDRLYEAVFLPAVDGLRIINSSELAKPRGVVLPERDYWPTEGWRTSLPEEQGMNSDKLDKMVGLIKENRILIKSTIIIRHGYIVLEENFLGPPTQDNPKSVTKSITSALVGIAIDQGYIEGVDQPVLNLFPEREIKNVDSLKTAMTVEDLLTMRSGLDWPAGPCWWLDDAPCADYTTQIMLEDKDSLQFILDQPMANEPGSVFLYNSGASHLLSALIRETTGMNGLEFAEQNLFEPLGIHNVRWQTDGEGLTMGWSDIEMLPRDMAKIGYLYLNEGNWNGEEIVSAEWVRDSQQPHTTTTPDKIQPNYGYQWWVNPELGFFNAAGSGGNYIIVVPRLDMVVVFTANITGQFGESQWWEATPEELFRVYILPAVRDQAELGMGEKN